VLCFDNPLLFTWHPTHNRPIFYKVDTSTVGSRGVICNDYQPHCLSQMVLCVTDSSSGDFVGLEGPNESNPCYKIHVLDGSSLQCKTEIGHIVLDIGDKKPTNITVKYPYVAIKFDNAGFSIWNMIDEKLVSEITFQDSCWVTVQLITESNKFVYCVANYEGQQTHIYATTWTTPRMLGDLIRSCTSRIGVCFALLHTPPGCSSTRILMMMYMGES
jgi:hypothetical protein